MTARVTLYTRVGCHLCEEARVVVQAVCDDLGEAFEEVDVDSAVELQEAYSDQVPVTLVDGRRHDFWRVDERRLRTALARPAG
ncbi:glutaredoxin family protein [Nocardioides aurantiacus]|uniref:Glutaredoxin n=1 Tax=Nocardioides aurantiacus TaxID=86796 RepID=A0A3N2CPZ8_9ACTN|nr:glutaredoxin family protein [Nocardioides aurantiacus]ROR89488.1 glutaredoxin [Nocardioides aurantiacus]